MQKVAHPNAHTTYLRSMYNNECMAVGSNTAVAKVVHQNVQSKMYVQRDETFPIWKVVICGNFKI